MRTYHTVIIIKSDLEESQVEAASEKAGKNIARYSGAILKLDKWGKKRLAYRVQKNRYGFYISICHTLDPALVAEYENQLRLDESILKYLVIRIEADEVARLCGEKSAASGAADAEKGESDDDEEEGS